MEEYENVGGWQWQWQWQEQTGVSAKYKVREEKKREAENTLLEEYIIIYIIIKPKNVYKNLIAFSS